jgi:hypothetical protein
VISEQAQHPSAQLASPQLSCSEAQLEFPAAAAQHVLQLMHEVPERDNIPCTGFVDRFIGLVAICPAQAPIAIGIQHIEPEALSSLAAAVFTPVSEPVEEGSSGLSSVNMSRNCCW